MYPWKDTDQATRIGTNVHPKRTQPHSQNAAPISEGARTDDLFASANDLAASTGHQHASTSHQVASGHGSAAASTRPLLEARGLSRSYFEGERERAVLANVDLKLREGEFVALIGPSGSGKSTLLNLLAGIDAPTAGTVRIAGTELTALSERERTLFRRHRIGFIFQFHNLLPTLTVEENLLLPLELIGTVGSSARCQAHELLERVGLAERAVSFPDRLSGGEQQRVAVARAVIHDPVLVLADEPTGNLDRGTGERVLDLLEGLVRSTGRTLLAVTHSEALAERADRVLVLEDGLLVERRGARV